MTAFEIVRHLAHTWALYWAVLDHVRHVFGPRPHGFGAWWIRTEYRLHPGNFRRLVLWLRHRYCQGGMGTSPQHPRPHWTWACHAPGM